MDVSEGWVENQKGNFCKVLAGMLCTVFWFDRHKDEGWKWVRDGEFSHEVFETASDAQGDAEAFFL